MSPLGYIWDVDRILMKPLTILSDMYLLEGSVTETNKKLVKCLLSTYLLRYRDAFLKAALNILPPTKPIIIRFN